MEKLKYTERNIEIMVKHEDRMRQYHHEVYQRYQKDFEEIGVELTATFFWTNPKQWFRVGRIYEEELPNCYTRPKPEQKCYEFLVHYEVMQNEKSVYLVSPKGIEFGDDLFETFCISTITKRTFSPPQILLYENTDDAAKSISNFLFQLKNHKWSSKDRSEFLV